jgi:hypothetical protein
MGWKNARTYQQSRTTSLTILKAIVDTAVDIYKMSLLKQFFNSTLLILTVIAVGNVCLGHKTVACRSPLP